ncbi:MAG: 16S rRNA (cytosine(1402)-N(4))-methyltransferase RsmH [Desulfobacterales bacterium]|nr:16S rRNA (cytosine(1402)-N(4))-methyltransferase RsmH [Desulfobacterales bacterium]
MNFRHIPVMLEESILHLNCREGKIYVDGTFGGGGHSKEILNKIGSGLLIGIDQDTDSISNAKALFSYQSNFMLFHDNFMNLPEILKAEKIFKVDGILLDLGMSQHQIESSKRGFSFYKDEPLDMRMNIRQKLTAGDVINEMDEKNLAQIFKKYGEEANAKMISKRIAFIRQNKRINSSLELAKIVEGVVPYKYKQKKIHPATKVFMALRIFINKELEALSLFLENLPDILNSGGRICIISFHSLEDRIVKQTLKKFEHPCICPKDFPICVCKKEKKIKIITKKPIISSSAEITKNPMARSAKLRVAEML